MADEILSEQWKTISNFPLYEVSDLGRIRRMYTGRLRRISLDRYGYCFVGLYDGHGRRKCQWIHVLVYRAFHGTIDINYEVNHKNGIKADNIPSNLEQCSHLDNIRHYWEHVGAGAFVKRRTGIRGPYSGKIQYSPRYKPSTV